PQLGADLVLLGAIEDRRRHVDAAAHVAHHVLERLGRGLVEHAVDARVGVDRLQLAAQVLRVAERGLQRLDRAAEAVCGPAEVRLEDLPDVHARGHAERVQHDVDRRAISEVRHGLLGEDARDHALVAVAPRHLVADRELAPDREVDLHHLEHAGRQLVAAAQAGDLLVENRLDHPGLLLDALEDPVDLLLDAGVLDLHVAPAPLRDLVEELARDRVAGLQPLGAPALVGDAVRCALALDEAADLPHRAVADDADLVLLVLAQALDVLLLERLGALVLLHAAAREDLGADHRPRDPRRHAQRGVAHVARLLAEDRAQQALLRRELRLALRRDLADEHVVGADLGADADDARLVEVAERLLADVRDVPGDLLLAELGVPRDALELLDVDRGVGVVLHHALGDQDRVLEVVPAPGHEGDDDVATERELAAVRRGAVGDHLALAQPIAPPA